MRLQDARTRLNDHLGADMPFMADLMEAVAPLPEFSSSTEKVKEATARFAQLAQRLKADTMNNLSENPTILATAAVPVTLHMSFLKDVVLPMLPEDEVRTCPLPFAAGHGHYSTTP